MGVREAHSVADTARCRHQEGVIVALHMVFLEVTRVGGRKPLTQARNLAEQTMILFHLPALHSLEQRQDARHPARAPN